MSWLGEFEEQLRRRGVRRGPRERLLAELADHLACEQELRIEMTRLGAAREIAGRYADELGADEARRGAFAALGALAFTAAAFVVTQVTLGRISYPGYDHGHSTVLALIAILALFVGSQVALVCGTLAAMRALRRRREMVLPAAEIALVNRRSRIGVGAGAVTAAGVLLYVVNFTSVLPAWWLALSGALAGVALGGLAFAWRAIARGASTVAVLDGPAGDIYDDLPPLRLLRGHPLTLWALVTLVVTAGATALGWHAEHSLAEGLQRGILEGVALSVGFAAFGRAIGARR